MNTIDRLLSQLAKMSEYKRTNLIALVAAIFAVGKAFGWWQLAPDQENSLQDVITIVLAAVIGTGATENQNRG